MDVAFQLLSGKCIDWDSAKTSFIEGLVSGLLPGGAVTDFLVGMAVDIGMRGETPANAFGNQMLGLGLDKFSRGFGKGARGADNAPRNGLRRSPTEAVERAGKNPGRKLSPAHAGGIGNPMGDFYPRVMRSSSSGGGGGDNILDEINEHIRKNGLPIEKGMPVRRQVSPHEMVLLTQQHNIEFVLGQERFFNSNHEITNERGGFWLFSGNPNDSYGQSVYMPIDLNRNTVLENLYHTHTTNKSTPSGSDIDDLNARAWQSSSGVIPNRLPAQVYPFDWKTHAED